MYSNILETAFQRLGRFIMLVTWDPTGS